MGVRELDRLARNLKRNELVYNISYLYLSIVFLYHFSFSRCGMLVCTYILCHRTQLGMIHCPRQNNNMIIIKDERKEIEPVFTTP